MAEALRVEGECEVYGGGLTDVGPRIADVDVIGEIERRWPWRGSAERKPRVKVWLGVEPVAEGELWALHGFGGTDVTPAESPEITVGDYDLVARLNDLDGRHVLLLVEDAPE